MAFIDKEVHFDKRGLVVLQKGLRLDPGNMDLSILKAEIFIDEGQIKKAQQLLEQLKQNNPTNKTIQKDLLRTYLPDGHETVIPAMDQHLFSLGQIQSPFEPDNFLVSALPSWNLNLTALGVNYSGGTVYIADAQLETPMLDGLRLITGRSEYVGSAAGQGSGTNSWTYAGIDDRINTRTDLVVEAGDTSLNHAGLYGHFFTEPGILTVDIQGVDNMIWGDFGQAIILNGSESGITASLSIQLNNRLSIGANYWYYEYFLNNGETPYGNLHNTFGYIDYQLTQAPAVDLMVGYDDWSINSPSPATASLVPEIMRQQYVLAAINANKQYDNGLALNGQLGAYNDFYNHLASYEGAIGIRYPVSMHFSFYGNALYFQESTLYSGPSEELMVGLNFFF